MTWTTQEPDPTCAKSARLGTRSISHFFLLAPFLAACGSSAQGEEAIVAIDACRQQPPPGGEAGGYGNAVHSMS